MNFPFFITQTGGGPAEVLIFLMVSIGLLVLLFRILTSRLFLKLSALLALAFLAFIVFLIATGQ